MTIKNKKRQLTIDYKDLLFEDLKDLDCAAGYLTAAIEEGQEVFLLAICDVIQALGDITEISKATKLNRENLYDMFSKNGNPCLSSLLPIIDNLGFEVKFTPKLQGSKAA